MNNPTQFKKQAENVIPVTKKQDGLPEYTDKPLPDAQVEKKDATVKDKAGELNAAAKSPAGQKEEAGSIAKEEVYYNPDNKEDLKAEPKAQTPEEGLNKTEQLLKK